MATGDGTFGGLTFLVIDPGQLTRPSPGVQTVTSERLSVGGSRRVRQFLGTQARELSLAIEIAKASLPTLVGLALAGTIGTLTVDGGDGPESFTSSYLDSIGPVSVNDIHDLAYCTVVWKGP